MTTNRRLWDLERAKQTNVYPLYLVEKPDETYVKMSDGRRVDPAEVPHELLISCKRYVGISPSDWSEQNGDAI